MPVKPRAARYRAAAAALLLALLSSAAAAAPVEVLRECAADAPKAARGIEKLSAACPNLSDALQMLGVDKLLSGAWRESLSPQALLDVAELSTRYDASQIHAGPHIASLPDIIAALNGKPAPANSWWQRLNSWLRDWLARHDFSLSGRFSRWLDELAKSPSIWKVAGFLCVALIVAAAVAVIVNELRSAGVWQRRGRARVPNRNADSAMLAAPAAGVVAAPAQHGASELLRQLVARLTQTGRLRNERSLTHREIIVRSRLDTEEQRNVLAGVAVTAERVTYGDGASAEPTSALIASGRALLAQLDKGPA
jgi:hypothetical protein